MTVKNEEEFIDRAISSVEDIATEIIIVDTGSTDSTKSLVRSRNKCVLYEREFPNHYGEARNIPIRIIRQEHSCDDKDYILSLDGDEIISHPELIPKYTQLSEFDGYYLTKNHLTPGGWFSNPSLKLFRNKPGLYFVGSICELLEPKMAQLKCNTGSIPTVINDMGFRKDKETVRKKIDRYIGLLEEKILSESKLADYLYLSYFQTLNGYYEGAFSTLDTAIQNTGDHSIALQKASTLFYLGDSEEAECIINNFLGNFEVNGNLYAEVMNKMGQIWSNRGEYEKALEAYQRAVGVWSERDVYWFNLLLMSHIIYGETDPNLREKANRRNPLIKEIKFSGAKNTLDTFSELDLHYPNMQEVIWL